MADRYQRLREVARLMAKVDRLVCASNELGTLRLAAHKIIFIRLHPVVPPLVPPLPKLPLKIRLQLLEEILESTVRRLEEILRLPSVRMIFESSSDSLLFGTDT